MAEPDTTSHIAEETEARSQAFFAGALRRIPRFMIASAAALALAALAVLGWRIALGFACGCAVAYLNFYWLERVVTALVDRAVSSGYPQSSSGIVFRFLVRYLLMAAAAYAILRVSPASLYGLLAGLFLPVAGIACEAAYELYAALARGI
jgi:small-conductance mechanosensitive channel